MIITFRTGELERLYTKPLNMIKGKQKFSRMVIRQYQAKVRILTLVDDLNELSDFKSLRFESLSGKRKGQFSIRLNRQYRLIFTRSENELIEIMDISKHYE